MMAYDIPLGIGAPGAITAFILDGLVSSDFTQAGTLGDLTTLWMGEYVPELKAADPTADDVDTLIRDDLATVRATVADQDDLNTLYAIYLSST